MGHQQTDLMELGAHQVIQVMGTGEGRLPVHWFPLLTGVSLEETQTTTFGFWPVTSPL